MILLERDIALPVTVEVTKAQVLHVLRVQHRVQEFDGVADLTRFLDEEVLDGLVAAGAPRGLTRAILFYRNPNTVAVVATRMVPGGAFHAFGMPGCWMQLGKNLDTLAAWAKRAEPAWVEAMPRGI